MRQVVFLLASLALAIPSQAAVAGRLDLLGDIFGEHRNIKDVIMLRNSLRKVIKLSLIHI